MDSVFCSASGLKGNKVLRELKLEVCEIGAEGTAALTQVLSGIGTLRALYLTWNSVHMESIGRCCLSHDR